MDFTVRFSKGAEFSSVTVVAIKWHKRAVVRVEDSCVTSSGEVSSSVCTVCVCV